MTVNFSPFILKQLDATFQRGFVYVVVQFCFWFNFDFPLFFSMLICDNEYQTKENQN